MLNASQYAKREKRLSQLEQKKIFVSEDRQGGTVYFSLRSRSPFVTPCGDIHNRYSLGISAPSGDGMDAVAARDLARKQAQRICDDLRYRSAGLPDMNKMRDVETVCDGMMSALVESKKSDSHRRLNTAACKSLRECFPDGLQLSEVEPSVLQVFAQHLQEKSLGAKTIKTYLSTVHAYLKKLHRYQAITVKIAEPVDLEKSKSPQKVWLTSSEILMIHKYNHKSSAVNRIKRAAVFSATTGLRYSDVRRLRMKHIQSDMHQGLERVSIDLVVKKSKRQIHIVLPNLARRVMEEAISHLPSSHQEAFIFSLPEHNGRVARYIQTLLQAAGIAKTVTFHDFRTTFTMLCVEAEISVPKISASLGHTQVSTTQHYMHLEGTSNKEANKINHELD